MTAEKCGEGDAHARATTPAGPRHSPISEPALRGSTPRTAPASPAASCGP